MGAARTEVYGGPADLSTGRVRMSRIRVHSAPDVDHRFSKCRPAHSGCARLHEEMRKQNGIVAERAATRRWRCINRAHAMLCADHDAGTTGCRGRLPVLCRRCRDHAGIPGRTTMMHTSRETAGCLLTHAHAVRLHAQVAAPESRLTSR